MSAAGLILAAGESRRMGTPKALLEYRGATFLDALIGLFAPRCSPVVVVLGAAADEVRAGVSESSRAAVHFVVNPDWRRGQLTSMQYGLRSSPPESEGVLFALVDHPAVRGETLDALLGKGATSGACLLRVPRYRGRRGHPVWLSRELIPEFLELPETAAAYDVVRRHAAETVFLDLEDPGIVADIDSPADYRALVGAGQ